MTNAIGLCTWIYGHQDHRRIAAAVADLGCDGVELFVDIQRQPAALLRDLYADQGLSFFSLTPENVDLCHPQPPRRQQAIAYYLQLLDYAVALGCEAVTIHEFVGRGVPPDCPEAEAERLVQAMGALASEAEQRGVNLLLEPLRAPLVSRIHTAADAVALCQQVGSPRLKIVLDTFHMQASETDVAAAIAAVRGHLGAVQLADRERRPLGQGGMDLDRDLRAFAAIGFQGPWILECSTELSGPSLLNLPVDPLLLGEQLSASFRFLQQALQRGSGMEQAAGQSLPEQQAAAEQQSGAEDGIDEITRGVA